MASFGEATVHEVAAGPAPEPEAAGELPKATSAVGADYVPDTPLEARIAEVIKGITEKREQKPKFVKIQLQFPKVAAVLRRCGRLSPRSTRTRAAPSSWVRSRVRSHR